MTAWKRNDGLAQVGIFGGTFNPIHQGHLLIAEFAREQFDLDEVVFVTSGTPPHRTEELLDHDCRHELVMAAVSTNRFFKASDMELLRTGPSYTIDTLIAFQEMYGKSTRLNLIIGGDNVVQLANWHRADEIFEMTRILVAPRLVYETTQESPYVMRMSKPETPGSEVDERMDLQVIDFPGVAFSSSLIRARLKSGRSVRYMVPREVNEILIGKGYYSEKKLYGKS